MVVSFTAMFEPADVLTAASMTAAMVVGLTTFACFCNMRLTWLWGIAAALSTTVWPLIIVNILVPSRLLYNILCFVVIIVTSIYIVYDTKLIMSKLSLDEYVIGALLLYVDII